MDLLQMNQGTAEASAMTGMAVAGRAGLWDMTLKGGRIAAMRPSAVTGGGLVLPLLADIHTHLDKTFTIARLPRRATSLFEAIGMMEGDAFHWTSADIRRRAALALARAIGHGTALMRSHVDWLDARAPLAWPVLRELAQDHKDRITLQLASLTPLDAFAAHGEVIAAQVRDSGGVLGAYVYHNDDLAAKVATVFDLAERHGLELDFHVDEGLETDARGIDAIVAEAERRRMGDRVLCGHACALSVRPASAVSRLLERAAAAGIGLTVLPGANGYLQDASPGRTPRLRGIAPMQEAQAAGMAVMVGSDNVRDGFFPYGDYDMIDVFRQAVLAGQLQPDQWLGAISETAAARMGRSLALHEGGPADFIWLDASDLGDLVSRATARRVVFRGGAPMRNADDGGMA